MFLTHARLIEKGRRHRQASLPTNEAIVSAASERQATALGEKDPSRRNNNDNNIFPCSFPQCSCLGSCGARAGMLAHNGSERSDLRLAPGATEALAGRQNLVAACGDIEAKLRNRWTSITQSQTRVHG